MVTNLIPFFAVEPYGWRDQKRRFLKIRNKNKRHQSARVVTADAAELRSLAWELPLDTEPLAHWRTVDVTELLLGWCQRPPGPASTSKSNWMWLWKGTTETARPGMRAVVSDLGESTAGDGGSDEFESVGVFCHSSLVTCHLWAPNRRCCW